MITGLLLSRAASTICQKGIGEIQKELIKAPLPVGATYNSFYMTPWLGLPSWSSLPPPPHPPTHTHTHTHLMSLWSGAGGPVLDSLPDPGLPFHRFLEGNLDDVATLVGDLLASFGYPGFVPGYPPGWACNFGLLPLLPS